MFASSLSVCPGNNQTGWPIGWRISYRGGSDIGMNEHQIKQGLIQVKHEMQRAFEKTYILMNLDSNGLQKPGIDCRTVKTNVQTEYCI